MTRNNLWNLKKTDLKDLNPEKARDLIINCFCSAQGEHFKRTNSKLSLFQKREIRENITSVMYAIFNSIGGDFDHPTKEILVKVVNELARMAKEWNTPEDIIAHHRGQILDMLSKLP